MIKYYVVERKEGSFLWERVSMNIDTLREANHHLIFCEKARPFKGWHFKVESLEY